MPALKTKTKSMASCVDEGSFLNVHRESSEVCKRKHSMVSESYEMVDGETKKICQNGPCEVGHVVKEAVVDESFHRETSNGGEAAIEHRLSPLEETTSTKTMDSSTVRCPSNLDMSFAIKSSGANDNCDSSNNSGSKKCPAEAQIAADNSGDQNLDSFRLQSSHDSDICISTMNMAAPSIDEPCGLDDIIRISLFQDFECAEPNLTFDITESSIMFSTLEDPAFQGRGFGEEFLSNPDNTWFQLVAHQTKPCDQVVSSASLDSDETESFDPHSFIRNILDLSDLETSSLPPLLPKEPCERKRVTLVLDLDETLIHSTTEPCNDADFSFKIFFNMEEHTVYVRQRPFLKTFLERVSELFEVVIFTASESVYAAQLLDTLDPERKFFSRRAYRESCIVVNGNYTKDLTILGVDLARIAIIDNCPQVFQLQVSNGIPIQSWFDDPSDHALMSLLPFLDTLAEADDVRPIIAKKFGVKE